MDRGRRPASLGTGVPRLLRGGRPCRHESGPFPRTSTPDRGRPSCPTAMLLRWLRPAGRVRPGVSWTTDGRCVGPRNAFRVSHTTGVGQSVCATAPVRRTDRRQTWPPLKSRPFGCGVSTASVRCGRQPVRASSPPPPTASLHRQRTVRPACRGPGRLRTRPPFRVSAARVLRPAPNGWEFGARCLDRSGRRARRVLYQDADGDSRRDQSPSRGPALLAPRTSDQDRCGIGGHAAPREEVTGWKAASARAEGRHWAPHPLLEM
ncbi:hypothetical protein RKD29_007603 [Streptomyces tendae]